MKYLSGIITFIILSTSLQAQGFKLGYDFLNHTVDGRLGITEQFYAGFKFDPGVHTREPGDDVDLNLALFGRFNIFQPVEGFGLGPDAAWILIRNSEADEMEFFINFSADMAFNVTGPIYIYGHVPLIGLEIIAYDNDNGNQENNNFAFNTLKWGYPTEFGLLFEF